MEFPAAIYLESTVLYRLPVDLNDGDLNTLCALSQRHQIPLYVPRLCIAEFGHNKRVELARTTENLHNQLRRLHGSLRAMQANSGTTVRVPWLRDSLEVPEQVAKGVDRRIIHNLRLKRIEVIPNASVRLRSLLHMAVEKIRPFEEKKEKGFRDTIILHTVLRHAGPLLRHHDQHVLLVSGDGVFDHPDVQQTMSQRNVRMARVASVTDAITRLRETADQAERDMLNARAERLHAFLLAHKEEILDFIRQEARADPDFFAREGWVGLGGTFSSIEGIIIEDIKIPSPVYPFGDSLPHEVNLSFVVVLNVQALYEVWGALPSPGEIPLREGAGPTNRIPYATTSGTFEMYYEQRTLTRSVHVKGSVQITEGEPEQYTNLHLGEVEVPRSHTIGEVLSQYLAPPVSPPPMLPT